jgi:hypothetical protein
MSLRNCICNRYRKSYFHLSRIPVQRNQQKCKLKKYSEVINSSTHASGALGFKHICRKWHFENLNRHVSKVLRVLK